MQFKLFTLALGFLSAAISTVADNTTSAVPGGTDVQNDEPEGLVARFLLTEHEFKRWLETTDAKLTFRGEPSVHVGKRGTTMVTHCDKRIGSICGGNCDVYQGGPTCLDTPGVACIAATNDVGFCDRAGCGHSCNMLSTCGTHLDNNFCYTPGTKSILVSA